MRLCYFAPEIPALSQTFVYREVLALRRRGHFVLPITVRWPPVPADRDVEKVGDVIIFYDYPKRVFLSAWGRALFKKPMAFAKVSMLVLRDFAASVISGRPAPALFIHYFTSFHFAELMETERIDHAHVHFAHFAAQIAMYASAYSGLPWTVMAHANDIYANGVLLKEKAERAGAMIMISGYNKDHIAGLGAPRAKMPVIRCGMEALTRTAPYPDHKAPPFRIGTLGRLVEKKGMATAIGAIEYLRAAGVDAHLDIVGSGPLKEALQKLIDEQNLGGIVTLLGPMANDDVVEWMQGLHVFCLACQYGADGDVDGIPVALMEAMALGAPVISTRITGIPELIIHEQSGLLCDPEDAAGLASAIRRYHDDAALYEAMRQGGLDQIAGEFSEDLNIDRLENLFQRGAPS